MSFFAEIFFRKRSVRMTAVQTDTTKSLMVDFVRKPMIMLAVAAATFALVSFTPAQAAELSQAAVDGFNRYAQLTEERINDQTRRGQFLWVDTLAAGQRDAAYARLRQGEVLEEKLETRDNGRTIEMPDSMIHHWVSVVFVSGVNLGGVKAFLQEYDNQYRYYRPDIVRSKLLSRQGDDFKIYLRMYKKKVVTVVLNTNHDVHYKQLDAKHLISTSYATRIAEVENPGTPKEHELPVGNDRGFLWRLNSYWRAEEKDGGVYVQCEAVTLTRDIPLGLKWLVGPFVNSAPKEFLYNMMTNLRAGAKTTAARSTGAASTSKKLSAFVQPGQASQQPWSLSWQVAGITASILQPLT